jgi:nitrogen fixation-related uncharacterized protein
MNKYITIILLVILSFLVGCQNTQFDDDELFDSDNTFEDESLDDEDLDICYPDLIYEEKGKAIGSTAGTLYLSKDKGETWYKENTFDLNIERVNIIDDNNIIIWDRVKNNFLYNLKTRKLTPYTYKKPLETFFYYPIKSFKVYKTRGYCLGGGNETSVTYSKKGKKILSSKWIVHEDSWEEQEREDVAFMNNCSLLELTNILKEINLKLYECPQINDLKISKSDINRYQSKINIRTEKKDEDSFDIDKDFNYFTIDKKDLSFYKNFPAMLNKTNQETFNQLLNRGPEYLSYNSFGIEITNENNDKITMRKDLARSPACFFIWYVKYKEKNFNCYNEKLSKFVDSCTPGSFEYKVLFNKSFLLMGIAREFKEMKNPNKKNAE